MEKLRNIFDVFSRRKGHASQPDNHIPTTFRTRLLQWCIEDLFSDPYQGDKGTFFVELHKYLRMRHGRVWLTARTAGDEMRDLEGFWQQCSTEEFLDIIEYICKLTDMQGSTIRGNDIVDTINRLLAVDDLPYYLTQFIYEEQKGPRVVGKFDFPLPSGAVMRTTVVYPQIIRRESEVAHGEIIVPALDLLSRPAFKHANEEYREALRHYRRDEYGDALTKAGSAFESVMKIICDLKGWTYDPTATAAPLVKAMLANSSLDSFFESLLMNAATIRNRFSKSHGAGSIPRTPSRQLTRYALNMTASAILLLVEEANLA